MNFTADLVAEELYNIETMRDYVVRTYSQAREDVFNVEVKKLPEFSLLHKMIFKQEYLDDYTKERMDIDQLEASQMGINRLLQAAKF